ncbi:MAG: hypothetical protein RL186_740 [Pseudomonadota bacterium]|jgi:tRNA pseudouridine38-40 synthase
MQRWKLTLEYDGQNYLGWQSQANGRGVQDGFERALARLETGTSGTLLRLQVAGRTDTGVHATGQVAHVDLEKPWQPFQLQEALNAWLRKEGPLSVLAAEPVDERFHARFSAKSRSYLYRMIERRAPLTFDKGKIWRVSQTLDLAAMQTAAHMLLGTHDFSTFRDGQCQAKSPIKTLDRFDLTRATGPFGPEIHARLEARSFLHRQVRSMMGSLCEVGKGRWTPADLKSALQATNRTHCGPVAPPDGLYLVGVGY